MARRSNRATRTTIADVAALAGVSPATVSRVMNNRFLGRPEVAGRVRSAAKELRYVPSPAARGLALGETGVIALVVPDLTNPAFHDVLAGLCRAAAADGYRVMVADTAESIEEEELLAVETRRRCDFLVLCAPRMPERKLVELAPTLQPFVTINCDVSLESVPSLSFDYQTGITMLLEHLYGHGHRQMLFLAGPDSSASNRRRLAGISGFVARHDDVDVSIVPCGVSSEDGYAASEIVIESDATAVLGYNDLVAVGLMSALAERGMNVPADMSITGFDAIPFAKFSRPSLTTISVPHADLGAEAWRRLDSLTKNPIPEHRMRFQPRLVLGGSTGPAPSNATAT